MTTKVTVDAHAGWPVKVTAVYLDGEGRTQGNASEAIVPPGEARDFYVHSGLALWVREEAKPAAPEPEKPAEVAP